MEAKNFGFRFIVLDRPGMGYSDFNPEQTLLDYPLDVKALAEHLSLERFGVMGWSGGAAPAMTCGYVIPDLIDFCILHHLFMMDQTLCFTKDYRGTALDACLAYQAWNYDIRNITTRIDIFHDTEDKLVPFAFAERNASLIKNCYLHPLENQGHFFPISHQKLIFEQARICKQLQQ